MMTEKYSKDEMIEILEKASNVLFQLHVSSIIIDLTIMDLKGELVKDE